MVVVAQATRLVRWIAIVGRNIDTLDQLKGKKIGVARGSGGEVFWLALIDTLKLNAADYTVINVAKDEPVYWGDDPLGAGFAYPLAIPPVGAGGMAATIPLTIRDPNPGLGSSQADDSAYASGAAYVFVRSDGAWKQQAYLKASHPDAYDNFGASVSNYQVDDLLGDISRLAIVDVDAARELTKASARVARMAASTTACLARLKPKKSRSRPRWTTSASRRTRSSRSSQERTRNS